MTAGPGGTTRVVGCGRWFRRDDQVGLLVVRALREMSALPAGMAMTEAPGSELTDLFDVRDPLILVDAAASDTRRPPGSWQVIDYLESPERLRSRDAGDTHTLSVDSALELARALGVTPPRVLIYAIAVADVGQGNELTPAVAQAVPRVAAAIAARLTAEAAVIGEGAAHA